MAEFDVFLSYKHSDENGDLTPDSVLAEELYDALTTQGICCFYASESIRKLGESDYSRVINDALDRCSVLVAVGTSAANLHSNWVEYEWSSFHNDILSSRKPGGKLLSYVDGIPAEEMPRELRYHQIYDRRRNTISEICVFVQNALKTKQRSLRLSRCRVIGLSEADPKQISPLDAERAFSENHMNLYPGMPAETAGTPEQWAEIIGRYPDYTALVIDDEYHIIGNYSIVGLSGEYEARMKRGQLIDTDLSADTVDNLYRPGWHTGYLLNLSVIPSSESAESYKMLWDHFIDMLRKKARERIFFAKIYFKAFLPEHEAKMAARGFRLCCPDALYGNVYVHDMDPESTLQVLDGKLAELYAAEAGKRKKKRRVVKEPDALSAYMDLWQQIEELFYHPDYYRLKRYFMEGTELPANSMEYKKGLAAAEWIRDNLQYSEALLPFIPKELRETHERFKERIYSSRIIRCSMNQYTFVTEEEEEEDGAAEETLSVKALLTFAQIWLDIDRMFMRPELVNMKQYFYEGRENLPDEKDIETGELMAVRILSVFRISEKQLKQLPRVYAASYFRYKAMICSAALSQRVFCKFPHLKEEIYR